MCTFNLKNNYLYEYDPWSGILVAKAFTLRSEYCTMLQAMPDQLVFDQGMILNTSFITDQEATRTTTNR